MGLLVVQRSQGIFVPDQELTSQMLAARLFSGSWCALHDQR